MIGSSCINKGIEVAFRERQDILEISGRCPKCRLRFFAEKKRIPRLNTYEIRCVCGERFIVKKEN